MSVSYENTSYLITFGVGRPSRKFGEIFLGSFLNFPLFCIENNRKCDKIAVFLQFSIEMDYLIDLKTEITTFGARGHSSLIIMTTFHILPLLSGGQRGQKGSPLGLKWQFFKVFDGYGQ